MEHVWKRIGMHIGFWSQKLAITLPTSGGRSVGIVRSRTQTMEFFYRILVGHAVA
jgi:hypothetical protein